MAAAGGTTGRAAGKRGTKASANAAAKRRADAAASKATAEGAKGKRLTAAKMVLRDSMVIARAAQGMPWSVIADEAGITERQCQRIVSEKRGIASPLDESPRELIDDLLVAYRLAIGDYEAMAWAWFDSNQAAALGAKKAADDTRERLAILLGKLGHLPDDLKRVENDDRRQQVLADVARVVKQLAGGAIEPQAALEELREMGLLGQLAVEEA